MNVRNAQNLSMLCDFYELTMSNGYFRDGYKDRITYFDLFFRQVPDGGGFAIAAGLEQVVRIYPAISTSPMRTSTISAVEEHFLRGVSASICAISGSPATSGPCRRARRCSRASRS